MLLVFSPKITNRIKYTLNLVFKNILDIDYTITSDIDFFKSQDNPKLLYCEKPLDNTLFIQSNGFLFENFIHEVELSPFEYNQSKAIFPVFHPEAIFPFDIFSAIFYLVSRYEEYLPFIKDDHNRFEAKQSIAYKESFLNTPIVNIWVMELKEKLHAKYPELKIKNQKYNFIPTFDIDNAFAYLHKGLFRNLGGFCSSLFKRDFKSIAERAKVLLRIKKDPYDTYNFMLKIQHKYNINPIYFILFSEYGYKDKNLHINNPHFRSLIKKIGDYSLVGIHPSYASFSSFKKMMKETEELSEVLHKPITLSRQHFLLLKLPDSYRNLIHLDITDDYTMGYASEPGFRASICSPYNFFDLEADEETKLIIHPFAMMDTTLFSYKNQTPNQVFETTRKLIDEVKKVDGTFYMLWHNESFADNNKKEVFEKIIAYEILESEIL